MQQHCIALVGPSGSGKGFIYKTLLDHGYPVKKVVSYTTREQRPGEIEGVDYHYISESEFRNKIEHGEMLESEEVFPGIFYGTPRDQIQEYIRDGYIPLLDIDIKGALRIHDMMTGDISLTMFGIFPDEIPAGDREIDHSIEILTQRLRNRGETDAGKIEKRMQVARRELVDIRDNELFVPIENIAGRVDNQGNPDFLAEIVRHAEFLNEERK